MPKSVPKYNNRKGITMSREEKEIRDIQKHFKSVGKICGLSENMKTLKHGQRIRTTMHEHLPTITVHTIEGFHAENKILGSLEEVTKKALDRREPLAWTLKSAAVLSDNYPGKEEALNRNIAEYEKAVTIYDREKVIIEGRIYIIQYISSYISDPVHFVKPF